MQTTGTTAYVGLPLKIENRVVGLFELAAPKSFPDDTLAEFAPLAGGLAQYIERKAAEERLRQQSELYRTTLHSIGDAVITTDVHARVTHLNELAESLTGWTSADAAGRPLESIFHIVNESTRQGVENPAIRALHDDVVVGLANHTILIGRDGTEHPIEDSAAPIRAADGSVVGCVLVFRDVTQRRLQERELLASEQQFRTLVNNSPDMIARLDPELRHIFVSPASARISGVAPDELLGKTALECGWSHGVWDAFVACCREAAQIRSPVTFEYSDERPEGLKHFVSRIVPELTANDRLSSYLVLTTDMTAQMQVEEELRQSVEETRTLLETLPIGVFIAHDREGRNITGNRAAYELLRAKGPNLSKSADETEAPRHFRVCRNGVEIPAEELPVQRAARGETVRNEELDDVFDDGTVIHTVISAAPLFDRAGRARGAVASILDVTERKRAEETLRESQRFLRSSLDALESHIAVIDESGVILEVNAAWRNFAQANQFVGSEYGVGANYLEVCDAWTSECGEGQEIAKGLRDIIAGKRDRFRFEYPCHSPTEPRWFLMQATRFQSPGLVRVVVAHENVTERRMAEEALHIADRRKDEFLATLAHELRNPLAPIRNGLQILQLAGNDAASAEHARSMIDRQLSQLVRLVDDLMDVSRISRGKIELRPEWVPLATVIQSAIETSRPLIEQMGHTLTVSIPEQPLIVNADLTRLAQVFLNLLNNAAKYSDPNGHIWLTVERQGSDVVVSIRDQGIGISPDQVNHIFEMFSQVERSLEKSQGGLGIGLTLVKRLVEMHGGTIEAHSAGLGHGSEFTIRLPIVVEAMRTSAPHEERSAALSSQLRILIVDDNRDGADSMAMMLKVMGNETRTAYDGLAAVAEAEAFQPDVVMLDIGMPKLNGYDACRQIRALAGGHKVIMIAQTGWGQVEDRQRTHEAGFDFHLVKPVDPLDLMKLLHGLTAARA